MERRKLRRIGKEEVENEGEGGDEEESPHLFFLIFIFFPTSQFYDEYDILLNF